MAAPTLDELILVSIKSQYAKKGLDISERDLCRILHIVVTAAKLHAELHAERHVEKEKVFKRYNGYEELTVVAEV